MKARALVLLGVIVVAGAGACESTTTESAEQARRKLECKRLEAHIFRITPDSRARLDGLPEAKQQAVIDQLVAKVPVEDLEQCAAADPAVITCMQAAPDVQALRACIPAPKKG